MAGFGVKISFWLPFEFLGFMRHPTIYMLLTIYILLSPVIAWGLLFLVAFIGFGGLSESSIRVSSWFIYICVGLIFIMPVFTSLLVLNRLRTTGFWKNIVYLLAVVPNVLLLLLLMGELISSIHPVLHFLGYATYKTCEKIWILWFVIVILYVINYCYGRFRR